MADTTGTSGNDFVHVSGDGLTPPAGYTDTPTATDLADNIYMGQGGDDNIHAGAGSDNIYFGSDLTAADKIDGGIGGDSLIVTEQTSIVFAEDSLFGIERLILPAVTLPVNSAGVHNFTFQDSNIASDVYFSITATDVGADMFLMVDFSAETDADAVVYQGGAGGDTVYGRNAPNSDVVYFDEGGSDHFVGGALVRFGSNFGPEDSIDGLNSSTVALFGYTAPLTITGAMMRNVPVITLGNNINLTLQDEVVAAGRTMIIDATSTGTPITIYVDGSSETNGRFEFYGGIADDTFYGGHNDDYFNLGGQHYSDDMGSDAAYGGDGDDTFEFGGFGDSFIDGGDGEDRVILNMAPISSAGGVTYILVGGIGLINIEVIQLGIGPYSRSDFGFTLQDAFLTAGKTVTFDASFAGVRSALTIEGALETDGFIKAIGGSDDDVLAGGQLSDQLLGNDGNDKLTGNGGADTLDGGAGVDVMRGGGGSDTYLVNSAADRVYESLNEGANDVVRSTASFTLNENIETLVLLGSADINATGNASANMINGNAGDNILNGRAGADNMKGGAGNDTYYADNTGDKVIELAGEGVDLVNSVVSFVLGDNVENLTVTGSANVNATGNDVANVLRGNGGNNVLNGGVGADAMSGGNGNDTYYCDNAGDTTSEAMNYGADTVRASLSWQIASNIENLVLIGSGAINGTGNGLANAITGNSGANWLNGGLGLDTLTGGGGADSFVFNSAPSAANRDTITDFVVVDDTIRIDDAVFLGVGAVGTLASGAFRVGAAAGDASDRIIYNNANGQLLYDSDGAGGATAVHFATLSAGLALTNADIVII